MTAIIIIAAILFLWFVACFVTSGGSYTAFFASISPLFWIIGKVIPHPPVWRRMTSKSDYARMGRHYGGYHGMEEMECFLCGQVKHQWSAGEWKTDPNNKGRHDAAHHGAKNEEGGQR